MAGLRRRRAPRAPALARRRRRRRRRLFHLARVQKLLAFDDLSLDAAERVRRRRAPSRVRVPALARLPGARLEGLRLQTPPTSSSTRRRCWRRSPCWSRTRPAGRCSGASGRGRGRPRPQRRRRRRSLPAHGGALHGARAAGDGLAAAPRARRARARGRRRRGSRRAVAGRVGCGSGARARRRPPDVRALPLAPVRGVPRRPLARGERRDARADRGSRSPRSSCRRALFFAWLLPVVRDTGSRAVRPGRAATGLRPVRGPARRASPTATARAPRSSVAPARSRSPRSSSCRSPGSRCGAAGRHTSSAGRSPSSR